MSPSEYTGKEDRHDGGDRRGGYSKKPYGDRARRDDGGDRGRRSGYGKKPYGSSSDGRRPYKPREDRPRREGDSGKEGRGYGEKRYGNGSDRSSDGRKDGYKPRNGGGYRGDGERRPYKPREDRPRREGGSERGYRGRRDNERGYDNGSDRSHDDRKEGYRPRNGGDRRGGDRRYEHRGDRGRRDRDAGYERRDTPSRETAEPSDKLTIPSDPQKILFKGIDCEVNGRTDLAMVLYLNGAVGMSKGCESNALRMIKEASEEDLKNYADVVLRMCPPQAVVEYEYLCADAGRGCSRIHLDSMFEEGDCHSQYCRIRLGEVEGDDPVIEEFAAHGDEQEAKVKDGLTYLKRKKDSKIAVDLLARLDGRKKLRQSVRTEFLRAARGDAKAKNRLEDLASEFPEAEFLLRCVESENLEDSLRNGFKDHSALIVSLGSELRFDDAFGTFLRAKKLQSDNSDWIQTMINAAVAGSDEAMEELRPVQSRSNVRKAFQEVCLRKGDAEGLVSFYDGEDTEYLDRYCSFDPDKIIAVGKMMNREREIDWLKRNYRKGIEECRKAIEDMVADESRHTKLLVYALHDVGSDLESAKLYFSMEGDPALPSYKWLAKVCGEEQAKEFVRSKFEEKGDMETFESIFIDDGYQKKSGGRRGPGGKKRY